MEHCPAGTSVQNMVHWAQVTHTHTHASVCVCWGGPEVRPCPQAARGWTLGAFDFGASGNMKHYNQVSLDRAGLVLTAEPPPAHASVLPVPSSVHAPPVPRPGHEGPHCSVFGGTRYAGGPQRRGGPPHSGESSEPTPRWRKPRLHDE